MKHLRNFIDGMRSGLDLWPDAEYVGLDGRGFERDARSLRSDSTAVSKDIRKAVRGAKQGDVQKHHRQLKG